MRCFIGAYPWPPLPRKERVHTDLLRREADRPGAASGALGCLLQVQVRQQVEQRRSAPAEGAPDHEEPVTQYMGSAAAVAAGLLGIDSDLNDLLKSYMDYFTFGNTKDGIVDIRDFGTTGVVAFARGTPFSMMQTGRLTIAGKRVDVKPEYRDQALKSIDKMACAVLFEGGNHEQVQVAVLSRNANSALGRVQSFDKRIKHPPPPHPPATPSIPAAPPPRPCPSAWSVIRRCPPGPAR